MERRGQVVVSPHGRERIGCTLHLATPRVSLCQAGRDRRIANVRVLLEQVHALVGRAVGGLVGTRAGSSELDGNALGSADG